MNESILHRRCFLLHLQERPGYVGPVLIKESAREQPGRFELDQLHNEYAVTRQLAGVAGVRPALAKEGTESRPALVLEYIQGHSLAELIRAGSLDMGEKLRLAVNLARVLSQVHGHRVMHKDLSSSNILIADADSPGAQGGVYLIDFGLASGTESESPSLLEVGDSLIGSLAYVSPEQTGRIYRKVDHRTDLYSLGVILYELFTGQLPFDGGDVLELIHDHIARQPVPPHEIEPGLRGPVSDIILKLLAKDANDRYQTARGLEADLESCLDQWQRKGGIEPFELGGDDFTGRLQIPQKLYGRQAEIEHLQTILDRAVTEQAQLLLVAGYSGVGKTSLVREIQKDVIEKNGIYIEGKFDQLRRTQPYSAWEQAFARLVDIWLAQSETSLAGWRDAILDTVGVYGQVLVDIVPALERLLGPQPGVPQLGGVENKNRSIRFFNRFIACVATPEHPLVVFLDDLQWIDPASLNLVEALFDSHSASRILVIGAYRSNEVNAAHPLEVSKDRMQANGDQVTVINLGDLPPDATSQLLADSLRLGVTECRDLGQVLVEKSAGNPFFFRQLLYSLEADGLLNFNRKQRRWMWNDDVGLSVQACGSVVDLMIEKIRALSAGTQRALSLAACMGGRFDASTLSTIIGQPSTEILTYLIPALQSGLIIQSNAHFVFAHDRIQEAAYSLIPESGRQNAHLEIGRKLLAQTAAEGLDEEIFPIVAQLNDGRALIDTSSEKTELAALNLRAAQKAKTASAYADAKKYIEIGLDLIGPASWDEQYELTLSLHNADGELAYLNGKFDQVTNTAALIHANARRILDRVRIYMTQIEAATAQAQFSNGLGLGLAALRDLGVDVPVQPTPEDSRHLHEKFIGLLTNEPMERLDQLTRMSDQRSMATSALLASLMSTAYIANPPLFPIISYHGAILTFESGLDVWSPFFVGGVALVGVASITPDTPDDDARRLIQFSRRLVDMIQVLLDNPITGRSRTKGLMMLAFTTPWFQTYKDSIEFSRATYESGNETGDWLYGAYGANLFASQSLAAGMNLPDYRRQLTAYKDKMERLGQVMNPTSLAIHLQVAGNFVEPSPAPHHLSGAHFNEDEWFSQAAAANDLANRHYLSIGKLILAYHFDLDETLDGVVVEAEEYLAAGACLASVAQFYFYQALARLRQIGNGNAKRHSDTMDRVSKNLRWMRLWSEVAPATFQHKHDLIAAERGRVSGDLEAALSHYEGAIAGAKESGFTHEEALANELYARFWMDRGPERFAGPLMREAHSLYVKWGAQAKAEHLATRFPTLLTGRSVVIDEAGTQVILEDGLPAQVDLRTALKASQDIASEIELRRLLAKLMIGVIENTGAQLGFLIMEKDGRWIVEARSSLDEPKPYTLVPEDIEESDRLAAGVVRYVTRTQETLVLDDASKTGRFVHDRYIQAHRVRSVLCVPLINRGKTTAVLYLENNLAPRVFSPQRIALLRMLSSQMAISIDNARIHADLESLLESRSRALASAEAQVRTLFENSPLGIALTDLDGNFLSVNKAVLKMLRITEEALLEHSVIECYEEPSDRDALLRRVDEFGSVQDFGARLVRHDGSPFYASLNVNKLVLEGNEVLLTMVQDVTDQITAEQETAVHEERARLARELHDAVSQTILSASLLADATARNWEEARAITTADLTRLSGMLRGALDEMRTLLLELRPAATPERTLGQLLGALTETMRARSSTAIHLKTKGDHVLPEQVTTTLYRIAQESLNNAVRHAHAVTIKVELVSDPDQVVLRIADDGLGFDVDRRQAGHHGLDIMRERAEEIGAVFEIESCGGCGTQVTVTWS